MRWRGCGAAVLLLALATGCTDTPEEVARQRAIERAQLRNQTGGTVVCVVLALLLPVVMAVLLRWRARRAGRPPVPVPVPVALWLGAAGSVVAGVVIAGLAGGFGGIAFGPAPADPDFPWWLYAVFYGPIAFAFAGLAMVVLALPLRLRRLGPVACAVAAAGHALGAALGVRIALAEHGAVARAGGVALVAGGAAGALGYAFGAAARLPARRAR